MSIPIDAEFSLGDDDPLFLEPICIQGEVCNKSGIVMLDTLFSTQLSFDCDRCMEQVKRSYTGKIAQTLVRSLSSDEDCDLIVLPDAQLNLSEAVREELYLQLPSKLLCAEDCKGLCSGCGTNLNGAECICQKQIDPRLAALLPLLDNPPDR